MIKIKNLMVLAAILLLLAGVSFLQKSKHQKATGGSATSLVLAGEFDQSNLHRLVLGKGSETEALVLVSSPEGWVAESYFGSQVDSPRVTNLLRALSNLKGEFRSDSDKVLAGYGLLSDQAVTIRGFDNNGSEILALDLGQTSKGSQNQFLRVPGSNKVFLSQTSLLPLMGIYGEPVTPTAQFFLSLQAVTESKLNIDGLEIRDGKTTLRFDKAFSLVETAEEAAAGTEPVVDRNSWEWKLNGKAATDLAKTKIDALLNSCSSIRANDVADPNLPGEVLGLDEPDRSLTLIRQDGSEMVLEFGASREAGEGISAGTYMRVAGNPTIWVVTDYTTKNIFKKRDDLKAE